MKRKKVVSRKSGRVGYRARFTDPLTGRRVKKTFWFADRGEAEDAARELISSRSRRVYNLPDNSGWTVTYNDGEFIDAGLSSQAVWDVLTGVKSIQKREAAQAVLPVAVGQVAPVLAPVEKNVEKDVKDSAKKSSQVKGVSEERRNASWRTRTSDPVIESTYSAIAQWTTRERVVGFPMRLFGGTLAVASKNIFPIAGAALLETPLKENWTGNYA